MTGRWAIRSGTHSVPFGGVADGLTKWEITIANVLSDTGYATGYWGKWHLGSFDGRLPNDKGFDEWFGIFMPAKVPAEALNRAATAVRGALAAQDLVDALAQMGLEARPSTPAELAALLKKDSDRWAPLIKSIGFTADS